MTGQAYKRVQGNVLARTERRLLTWICVRLPRIATPDRLTALGIFGALVVFTGYVLARQNPAWLWLSSFGFLVHWFGDSLDGSLARHRGIERPRYGYFLDHATDAICNFAIMGGLGLAPLVRMDVSLAALIGYYLLCMYVFLDNFVSGVFQLSFLLLGPTELRVCLIAINTAMFVYGDVGRTIGGQYFTIYDAILLFAAAMFTLIFIERTARRALALRAEAQVKERS